VAEGGGLGVGPHPVAGGHHHDHPARGRQHPPDLAQKGERIGALLQGVDDEDAVEQGVGERQGVLADQAGEVRLVIGPDLHPLLARHGRHHPPGGGAERAQERGGVAEAQDVEAAAVAPALLDLAGRHLPRRPAEVGGVELAKLEHVAAHALLAMLDGEASPP
jgi:hypothetical protein